jgi:hypothetical protein
MPPPALASEPSAERSGVRLTAPVPLCDSAHNRTEPGLAAGKSGQHTVSQQMRLDRPAAELRGASLDRASYGPRPSRRLRACRLAFAAWRSPSSFW